MKKLTASMLTVAVSCMMAVPVMAGDRAGAFTVTPFGGGYTFDGRQHQETAPLVGLRLGMDVTDNLGIEAVGGYGATEGTRSTRSINVLSYHLDFLFNLVPQGPVVPYLAVGGGAITAGHGDKFRGGSNTDATANAGLGMKFFLTDDIALRADARQVFLFEEHNSVMYNWEYTGGITFLFGGAKKATGAAAGGQAKAVAPAPTVSFDASPAKVTKGEPATLSWNSQDATECEIKPDVGAVKPQGSITVTPGADTTYNLSCTGPGGTSNSTAKVATVAPAPTANLTVTPPNIKAGEQVTLNWDSKNASNCIIEPEIGTVQPQGNMNVSPSSNTTYTLKCESAGGVATTSAANVAVAAVPPAVGEVTLCQPTALTVLFDSCKSDIKPEYEADLKRVGDFLTKFPKANGVISGYADSAGTDAYNMNLSQSRANSVRDYLVKNFGIAPERIKTMAYGEAKPVATNDTQEGKAQNRRVDGSFSCE